MLRLSVVSEWSFSLDSSSEEEEETESFSSESDFTWDFCSKTLFLSFNSLENTRNCWGFKIKQRTDLKIWGLLQEYQRKEWL